MKNYIVYDIEIEKAIPQNSRFQHPGVKYCKGWDDKANMGVSVIGCYDSATNRTRVFCKDNFGEFADLCEQRDLIIGFNSIPFDNEVVKLHGIVHIPEEKSYDLLREIWGAAGLSPTFSYPSHMGYSLDAICTLNFGWSKTGHGSAAPVKWQLGSIGTVIDYCLNDVAMTHELFKVGVLSGLNIIDPKTEKLLTLRQPW